MEIQLTGTLGILFDAKKRPGLIQTVMPLLDKLLALLLGIYFLPPMAG